MRLNHNKISCIKLVHLLYWDTFVYNLTNPYDAAFEMASILANWHIVM